MSVMFRALINLTALLLLSPLDTGCRPGPGQMSAVLQCCRLLRARARLTAAPRADGECLLRIRCRPSLLVIVTSPISPGRSLIDTPGLQCCRVHKGLCSTAASRGDPVLPGERGDQSLHSLQHCSMLQARPGSCTHSPTFLSLGEKN